MDPSLSEWINLITRWVHVFAGILWVGSTYYFTWLDGRFNEQEPAKPDSAAKNAKPQVWMVHSGGFYVVKKEKQHDAAHPLHWFRWESAITWLSGIVLLAFVYWHGGLMVDTDVAKLSSGQAVGIGVVAIVAGWTIYDLLARSPLVNNESAFAAVGFLLIAGMSYALAHLLSGRAAYMHVGAVLGTIMTANVWHHIIPAQRRMVAAVARGETPDAALGTRAKRRSKHNTFLAVPVTAIMISNHFPLTTYGNTYHWIVLCVLVLAGWAAARLLRRA